MAQQCLLKAWKRLIHFQQCLLKYNFFFSILNNRVKTWSHKFNGSRESNISQQQPAAADIEQQSKNNNLRIYARSIGHSSFTATLNRKSWISIISVEILNLSPERIPIFHRPNMLHLVIYHKCVRARTSFINNRGNILSKFRNRKEQCPLREITPQIIAGLKS